MQPHPLESYIPPPLSPAPNFTRETRSERLVVLVSASEKERILARAAERNLSVAALIRGFLQTLPPPALDLEAVAALHHLQNAVWVVYKAAAGGAPMDEDIESLLGEVRSLYRDLIDRLGGSP